MRDLWAKGLVCAGLMVFGASPVMAAPVVLELFQSQGCSDCPPAIANINARADRPDLIALDFAITYWDQLGWKDTFARPEFTQRQRDYAHGLHNANVYTPQIVVNGKHDLVGSDGAELDGAIRLATPLRDIPLSLAGGKLSVGAVSGAIRADVWLVRYDPRIRNVAIGAGENSGLTLPHKNIVRALTRLGGWSGAAEEIAVPPSPDPAWRTAILVQSANGGPMIAALKL